ncbi:hypothetical protein IE81DRAFT_322036 [Ceraceosorus guamensis]|uniref:Uncharacterized protein n=1 Tax=Ceraceosorus guamensis TaxID=1522189 RepID=A0A316W286_9BASI|nr:hypothetical protein IE81DRAFT_322036 [Ceraceosorus guamensis]PWN43862.1 hypothetical protein IE81DRAFT_322036 [Ceraceosorus guamensis]
MPVANTGSEQVVTPAQEKAAELVWKKLKALHGTFYRADLGLGQAVLSNGKVQVRSISDLTSKYVQLDQTCHVRMSLPEALRALGDVRRAWTDFDNGVDSRHKKLINEIATCAKLDRQTKKDLELQLQILTHEFRSNLALAEAAFQEAGPNAPQNLIKRMWLTNADGTAVKDLGSPMGYKPNPDYKSWGL